MQSPFKLEMGPEIPTAYAVAIAVCDDDNDGRSCGRPHLILLNKDGEPFAQAVLSETWWPEIQQKIQDVFYATAAMKG